MSHPSSDTTRRLRQRILLSLGLGVTFLPACHDVGWNAACRDPNYKDPIYVDTVSLDSLHQDSASDSDAGDSGSGDSDGGDSGGGDSGGGGEAESCPTEQSEVDILLIYADVSCQTNEFRLLEQSGRDCTYEYTCRICCGYGRPYLDANGEPVEADTLPLEGWTDDAERPVPTNLTAEERAILGNYWLENARSEHSSVAGFHRFALDLLAHGAPPELLARAQKAAGQELRHTIDCFTLASFYLGHPVGPAPLEMGGSAPVAKTPAELAAWTVRDGAIGETLAAHLAERALATTSDPAVRAVLATIVRDESEHAELAWATVQWALNVGGEDVRDAVRAVLDGLGRPAPRALPWTRRLAAHGIAAPEVERVEAQRCIDRVILPVASALLSEERAAA